MSKHIVLVISALGVSIGAQAAINVSPGSPGSSFLTLVAGGNVTGGAVYPPPSSIGSPTIAAIPYNASPVRSTVGDWLAAGPSHGSPLGSPAKLDLVGLGATAVTFLWGSPDTYNTFSVETTSGVFSLVTTDVATAALATFAPGPGNQSLAYYVKFETTGSLETFKSITFGSPGTNAIEISNVTVVPEPEAYGLALAGMGVVAFAMRRRRAA